MENSFIKKISNTELTKTQVRIADYIAKNQKRVFGMTAQEVGREVGVSDASVIRFSRTLGYCGFTDMKEHLRQEYRENNEKIGKRSLFDRFVLQETKYNQENNSSNEMTKLMGINLETSLRQNEEAVYEKVASRILKARRKVIIGLRGGKGCAVQFGRLLGHVTENVSIITEESHDMLAGLAELNEQDVVLFLNCSRYYKIDGKIADIISGRKVACFLIADSMSSPVTKYADEIMLAETEHCGFFHSMIGIMGILEYLLILICRREPEKFRAKLKERDDILAEYRKQ